MSDILERAMAALEGVTERPWEVNREGWACISSGSDSVFHPYVETTCIDCDAEIIQWTVTSRSIEDAEFIAQARTLVPELVAEAKRLRAELFTEQTTELNQIVQMRATIERVRALALNPLQILDGDRRIAPVVIPSEILAALENDR